MLLWRDGAHFVGSEIDAGERYGPRELSFKHAVRTQWVGKDRSARQRRHNDILLHMSAQVNVGS